MKYTRFWRWAGLFATLVNIAFNYLYNRLPSTGTGIDEVTDSYNSLFTPAGYAFSIWGLIYLSFITYAICQLLPWQKSDRLYDKLSIPFVLVNMLSMLWIRMFSQNHIGTSVGIITAILLLGGVMFGYAKEGYLYEGNKFWITIPFSLFLGWISVASIANVSLLLISLRWRGGSLGEATWTSVMISAAFLLAVVISISFKDFLYPLVVAWACIAIWVSSKDVSNTVALVALVIGIVLAIWSVGYAIWHFVQLYSRRYRAHIDA